jgi:outer membrane biosynthesis protein TonB
VVDAQGRVNAVRGLVTPRSVGETLLLTQALSAVKSWPFKPATKDGLPVAYRQVVPLRELLRDAP